MVAGTCCIQNQSNLYNRQRFDEVVDCFSDDSGDRYELLDDVDSDEEFFPTDTEIRSSHNAWRWWCCWRIAWKRSLWARNWHQCNKEELVWEDDHHHHYDEWSDALGAYHCKRHSPHLQDYFSQNLIFLAQTMFGTDSDDILAILTLVELFYPVWYCYSDWCENSALMFAPWSTF